MDIMDREDELYKNFLPLAWTRPFEELRCGARTLKDHPPRKAKYLWDLIKYLKEDLEEDLRVLGSGVKGKVHPSVILYQPENILIDEGAEIESCAVLDARSGPIYIGKKSIIRPQSYLKGPLSIGPDCRIGGEVNHSIFYGHSNKAHFGFIGHSYVGEWVNLGAGTTNSNLKNNYGSIKVYINGKEVDSGEQFLGCFIGDHAKLGIGTLIPTGAVIGTCANIFGGGMIPKFVPSFSWGLREELKFEKAIETIAQVMRRRGKELSSEGKELFRQVFLATAGERKN